MLSFLDFNNVGIQFIKNPLKCITQTLIIKVPLRKKLDFIKNNYNFACLYSLRIHLGAKINSKSLIWLSFLSSWGILQALSKRAFINDVMQVGGRGLTLLWHYVWNCTQNSYFSVTKGEEVRKSPNSVTSFMDGP